MVPNKGVPGGTGSRNASDRADDEATAATALAELVQAHGLAKLSRPAVVRGMLADRLGERSMRSRREIGLLVAAAESLPSLAAGAAVDEVVVMLRQHTGVEDSAARWAVDAWARALTEGRADAQTQAPGDQEIEAKEPTTSQLPTTSQEPGMTSQEPARRPRRAVVARSAALTVATALLLACVAGLALVLRPLAGDADKPAHNADPVVSVEPDEPDTEPEAPGTDEDPSSPDDSSSAAPGPDASDPAAPDPDASVDRPGRPSDESTPAGPTPAPAPDSGTQSHPTPSPDATPTPSPGADADADADVDAGIDFSMG